jgi:ribosomal protein S8E
MKLTRIVVPVAAAGVIAICVTAVASAAGSPSPGPSSGSSADSKAQKGRGGDRLLRHALHGEFTVGKKDGSQTHVAVIQRGEITTVDTNAKTLTMKSPDGFTRTYVVTSNTKIRSKGADEKFTDLKAGERAMVTAEQTGSSYTARVIRCVREPKSSTTTKTG